MFTRQVLTYIAAAVGSIFLLYVVFHATDSSYATIPSTWIQDTLNKGTSPADTKYNASIIKTIQDGSLFKLSPEEAAGHWRKPYLFDDPFAMNQVPIGHKRCSIYTYFDHDVNATKTLLDKSPKKLPAALNEIQGEIELVNTWARSMWAIGLNPVILRPKDATHHPKFEEFAKSNVISAENRQANTKYFAWLASGAGIFADYRVIPTTRNLNDPAIELLRSCDFKEPLAFDDNSLSLIVSKLRDLRPFLFDVMRGHSEKELTSHFEVLNQDAFSYYSNRNFRAVTNQLRGTEEDDAPVPVARINSMVQSHLKQIFLEAFPGGIFAASPSQFALSSEVVRTLAKCPENRFVNTCPPTSSTLHLIASDNTLRTSACKPLPCSARSRGKSIKTQIIGEGIQNPYSLKKAFTVATLPHSLTLFQSENPDAELTVDYIRQQELRNPMVKSLTQHILSSSYGDDLRLQVLKDSIYQHTFGSNVTWILLDDSNVTRSNDLLEWDLGFPLSESNHKILDAPISAIPLNLSSINDRIINDLTGNDYQYKTSSIYNPDEVFDALKDWHRADYELWRFLQRWRKHKEVSLVILQHQLEALQADFTKDMD